MDYIVTGFYVGPYANVPTPHDGDVQYYAPKGALTTWESAVSFIEEEITQDEDLTEEETESLLEALRDWASFQPTSTPVGVGMRKTPDLCLGVWFGWA
jgi:hypothetical protein